MNIMCQSCALSKSSNVDVSRGQESGEAFSETIVSNTELYNQINVISSKKNMIIAIEK